VPTLHQTNGKVSGAEMTRCRIHFDARNPENSYALPIEGIDELLTEQAEAAALAQGEELTRILRTPIANISDDAGEMERNSPLFFGKGDNPTLF
jgi:hypothetical protein